MQQKAKKAGQQRQRRINKRIQEKKEKDEKEKREKEEKEEKERINAELTELRKFKANAMNQQRGLIPHSMGGSIASSIGGSIGGSMASSMVNSDNNSEALEYGKGKNLELEKILRDARAIGRDATNKYDYFKRMLKFFLFHHDIEAVFLQDKGLNNKLHQLSQSVSQSQSFDIDLKDSNNLSIIVSESGNNLAVPQRRGVRVRSGNKWRW